MNYVKRYRKQHKRKLKSFCTSIKEWKSSFITYTTYTETRIYGFKVKNDNNWTEMNLFSSTFSLIKDHIIFEIGTNHGCILCRNISTMHNTTRISLIHIIKLKIANKIIRKVLRFRCWVFLLLFSFLLFSLFFVVRVHKRTKFNAWIHKSRIKGKELNQCRHTIFYGK